MTMEWPTASTFHPRQCQGTTKEGKQCKHRAWREDSEVPNRYFCSQHEGNNNVDSD